MGRSNYSLTETKPDLVIRIARRGERPIVNMPISEGEYQRIMATLDKALRARKWVDKIDRK